MSQLAPLGFDLLVCGNHRELHAPMWCAVEVKVDKSCTLTPTEEERQADMQYLFGDDAPLIVAYEASDVLRWFGAI